MIFKSHMIYRPDSSGILKYTTQTIKLYVLCCVHLYGQRQLLVPMAFLTHLTLSVRVSVVLFYL